MDNRQHNSGLSRMASFLQRQLDRIIHVNRSYTDAISRALPHNYFQGLDPDDRHAQLKLARRRAKNKVARKSRRINRQRARR